MENIVDILVELFRKAVKAAYPDIPDIVIPVAPSPPQFPKFGDYQCNAALHVAKLLKDQGKLNLDPNIHEVRVKLPLVYLCISSQFFLSCTSFHFILHCFSHILFVFCVS